jgi:hypothetical protein
MEILCAYRRPTKIALARLAIDSGCPDGHTGGTKKPLNAHVLDVGNRVRDIPGFDYPGLRNERRIRHQGGRRGSPRPQLVTF